MGQAALLLVALDDLLVAYDDLVGVEVGVAAGTSLAQQIPALVEGHLELTDALRTAHAVDHPVGFPEGGYLKAVFATVTPSR